MTDLTHPPTTTGPNANGNPDTIQNDAPKIDPDQVDLYRLYRERIAQENNHIDNRMTWTLASQALLFALWIGLYGYVHPFARLYYIVDGAGGMVALVSVLAVLSAENEIDCMEERYRKLFPNAYRNRNIGVIDKVIIDSLETAECRYDVVPALTGSARNHLTGHLVSIVTAVVIALLWVTMAVFTHIESSATPKRFAIGDGSGTPKELTVVQNWCEAEHRKSYPLPRTMAVPRQGRLLLPTSPRGRCPRGRAN